mgnify:CR=1 FL=1
MESIKDYDSELFQHYSRVGHALSSPKRMELLDLLAQGPGSVESLAKRIGASIANTSRHLQILREGRFVIGRREGRSVIYRIGDESVTLFLGQLRSFADGHFLEIEKARKDFIEARIGFDPVDREELLRRVRDGEALVIDVRPDEEFGAGHLAGALSIPLDELERRLDQLPKDREIVAYCRGPHCVLSVEAVQLLRNKGFRAHRVDLGPAEFTNSGFSMVS